MKLLKLKLERVIVPQFSKQSLNINKIVNSLSLLDFIYLANNASIDVNPRIPTTNKVVKSIIDTLETSPKLFWIKSKGILLSTTKCNQLNLATISISLGKSEYDGIMDGGHTTYAIIKYVIDKLYAPKLKKWCDYKTYLSDNYDLIVAAVTEKFDQFQISIPIEIIYPDGTINSEEVYKNYISEICNARNNNVALTEAALGNQLGLYDSIADSLSDDNDNNINWKEKSSSEPIIKLSTLPLHFLQSIGKLPFKLNEASKKGSKGFSKHMIYTSTSTIIRYYKSVIQHPEISNMINGKYEIYNSAVNSVAELVPDILKFYDRLFLDFPYMFNKDGGSFGKVAKVRNETNKNKVYITPFETTLEQGNYPVAKGWIYPLVCGVTSLMTFDEKTQTIKWRVKPESIDLKKIDLSKYFETIRDPKLNLDPEKIGKCSGAYVIADQLFEHIK